MSSYSVGIIGCGWLGKALLKQLQKNRHQVIATFRSKENQKELIELGAKTELLSLPFSNQSEQHFESLDQDIIVISIPPRLRHSTDYPKHIKQLIDLAEQQKVKHVILISSTAIYNGLSGEVDENSRLNFDGEKVVHLQQAEQYVAEFSKQSSILRLAGLLGEDRHPSRFVKAGKVSDNSDNAVNLIHQTDVIGLILKIIDTTKKSPFNSQTHIFNGVSDTHCSRQTFYETAAESRDLSKPSFSDKQTQMSRTVKSKQTRDLLGYTYQYDDLLNWLRA